MGNKINFKPATFYLGITDHLAKAVEGLKSEDVDLGGGRDERGAKRGRGEILDEVSQGIAQVQPKRAPVGEDGVTTDLHPVKIPTSKRSNTKGPGESSSIDP
jgi:hypothetical protein